LAFGALFPFAAAFSCLEVAIVFAVLYRQVSRRRADLVFSGLSLCVAAMLTCDFLYSVIEGASRRLVWLRAEHCVAILTVAVFLHFVSVVAGKALPRPVLALNYALGLTLAAVPWSDLYLSLPSKVEEGASFTSQARGPLWPLFYVVLALAVWGWTRMATAFWRRENTALGTLTGSAPYLLLGYGLIIAGGACVAVRAVFLPRVGLPMSPHSVAVVFLCLLTALALGREALHSERERRRLAELVRFRDQAVRDVAHELKNPLAAIQGAAMTIARGLERGLEVAAEQEMAQMCIETCQRLMRLLNNMLDTARIEAGREVELRLQETDLLEPVEAIVASQRLTTATHEFRLESELAGTVLPVDADKLWQILTNLIDNAIKYSPAGGQVTVRLYERDGDVCFSVSDEGIGMTPEQQTRLFQPFERVVDPGRKITGTGIGLHLVKRLVDIHGGRIWVESAYGKGSTFTVALPKRPVAEASHQ